MAEHLSKIETGIPPRQEQVANSKDEIGALWRNRNIAGVELFRGDFCQYSFTRHFHSALAFGAVESGAMRTWHRDSNYTIAAGTVMMFNPGDVLAPFPANSKRWVFRMFYLQDALYERLSSQITNQPIRFASPFCSDAELARKILKLHSKLEKRCEQVEFDCRMLEILEHLQEYFSEDRRTFALLSPAASVTRMRDYIHAHIGSEISLPVLADVGHLSMYHALRSFRDVLGLPPHKYLLQLRVERAKELLQLGRSIAEVAATLGFADQSHLTRQYKRVFGVPPAQSLRYID